MRDLAFAGIWVLLVPAGFLSAEAGVLAWAWTALLSPNELLFGFAQSVPYNKVAVGMTAIGMVTGRERKEFYLDRTLFLLLLLLAVATGSWLGGIVPSTDADDLYQKLVKEIVLTFAITGVMRGKRSIDALVFAIALGLCFLGVKEGLIFVLTAGGHRVLGSQSIGDNNSLATALLMVVPLLSYLARHAAVPAVRACLWGVLGLSVVTVIATFSRGGFIGLLLLGLLLVGNSRHKLRAALAVATIGILIYLLAPESWFHRIDSIDAADNDASFMGRVVAWKISWLIAAAHPFFGGGPHAVQHLFVWQTFKPLLYRLDFIATPPPDEIPHAAHSIYFEVLGDLGFLGLGLFLALLASAFLDCRRIRRLARGRPDVAWAADLALMLQVSLLLYAVTGAALSMGYFELLYILLALTSRCRRTVAAEVATAAAAVHPIAGKSWPGGLGRRPRLAARPHRQAG